LYREAPIIFFWLFLTIFAKSDTKNIFPIESDKDSGCSSGICGPSTIFFRPKNQNKTKISEIGQLSCQISDFAKKRVGDVRFQIESGKQEKKVDWRSVGAMVRPSGSWGSKAPPLVARRVPWNGRGRRLVELTNGCDSGGNSQGLPGSKK